MPGRFDKRNGARLRWTSHLPLELITDFANLSWERNKRSLYLRVAAMWPRYLIFPDRSASS